jgi:hypothetical protein
METMCFLWGTNWLDIILKKFDRQSIKYRMAEKSVEKT